MVANHFQPPPFHPNRPTLVAPVPIDPAGLAGPTRKQARGPRWRTTSHGLRVPSSVDFTVEQRIVEAAASVPSRGGAVTGWAALRWQGGRWFEGSSVDDAHGLAVDLAMYRDIRSRPGIAICEERWEPNEVTVVDGVPITVAVRSVAFMMRRADGIRDAARAFAMGAYDDLVTRAEMTDYIGLAPRQGLSSWTGVPQARKALALADENCWSPQEVTMMLIWRLDADLPAPLMNQPIFDLTGRHIGTPDLLEVESGTLGEYDGALHLTSTARSHDVGREERYRDVGLECFTMLAGDASDREAMARRMRAARGRARWLPPERRAWTITPPPRWVSTVSVDQRRRLTVAQRVSLLRYRRDG